MLTSLDHVVVAVRDLDAATASTVRLLGREPSWRGIHPGAGTANTLFRLENTYLELLAREGDGDLGASISALIDERGEGVAALAFGTDDAAAVASELRAAGLDPIGPSPGEGTDRDSGARRHWRNVLLPPDQTRGCWLFAIEHAADSPPLPLREPAEPAACPDALDHVVVMSPDLEAARWLYGDALGLRLALDRSFEERGTRLLFFRVGGATVEVGGSLEEAPDREAPDRFWGLAWRVPDADAARARLEAADVDVSEVRPGAKRGTRVFTVRGEPCGVPTLLIQPAP